MAIDHNPQGRRGHFHRGRRGSDRRGPERRQGPPPPDQPNRERGERVDVEQIMREIRSRIAQRSGVDLSNQQIQELAAHRLEAILDPRGLKPGLLDQLRRSAGERQAAPETSVTAEPLFEEVTLYDSPNALLRFIRKVLNPILRLFFNPTPIVHALAVQGRLNAALATREADRDRRQAEWNALHYELLQRIATEIARVSLEAQSLSLKVESLSAKVDFNERRVRGLEGTQVQVPRPQRAEETPHVASIETPAVAATTDASSQPAAEGQPGDAPRRRRRRRRGRRGTGTAAPQGSLTETAAAAGATDDELDAGDNDEGFDDDAASLQSMTSETPAAEAAPPAPDVPLDHRLPAAEPGQETGPAGAMPAQGDSDPASEG